MRRVFANEGKVLNYALGWKLILVLVIQYMYMYVMIMHKGAQS